MKEALRQIKMGWYRGFQLGLVAGGISTLLIVSVFIGFFFTGSLFSKDTDVEHKIVEIEVKAELTEEEQKMLKEFKAEKDRLEEEEYKKRKAEFERDKAQWLTDNPPVKVLFNGNRRDLEYTISYIRENWYHGDCALVWRSDIICWDFGGNKLIFPTQRPE